MVLINNTNNNSQDDATGKRNVVFDAIIGVAMGLTICIDLNTIRGYFSHTLAKSILPEAIKEAVDSDSMCDLLKPRPFYPWAK